MPAMVCRKPIQKDTKQFVDSARTQFYSSGSLKPHGLHTVSASRIIQRGALSPSAPSFGRNHDGVRPDAFSR